MGVAGFFRQKIKQASVLLTREELQSVMALTVVEPPKGARYQVGDIISSSDIGRGLGRFRVYGVKGGGYGFAYVVLDEKDLTPYCLKTSRNDSPEGCEQIKQEAETWLRLGKHPNLIYVHSVLIINGSCHILFEYAAGADLGRRVKQGPIPIKETLEYAIQFCRGMRYAQGRIPGFVHGDIKPGNCLVAHDRTLKIADFGQVDFGGEPAEPAIVAGGLASTSANSDSPSGKWRAGTPPYMAPEQFDRANKIDPRSDVYSFGVMLFELLTGARPFTGRRHRDCFEQHRNEVAPDPRIRNPAIPPALAQLVLSCLAKSPAERPRDFALLEDQLSSLLWTLHREKIPPAEASELSDEEVVNRGLSFLALNCPADALACFDQALAANPEFAKGWCYKGDAFYATGGHHEALRCFERALELDPKQPDAWDGKGKTLARLGQAEAALECFDRALRIDRQQAYVWNDRSVTLEKLARPVESLQSLQRALALDPKNFAFHHNLGLAFSALGQTTKAIHAFQQSVMLNQQHAATHCHLGHAYHRGGQLVDAIESYRRAIDRAINRANDRAINIDGHYDEAARGLEAASLDFYRSSEQYVSDAYARELLSFLFAEHSDSDDAVLAGIKLLRRSEFDPRVFFVSAARIYSAAKRLSPAVKDLLVEVLINVEQRCLSAPDRPNLYWLGKIYYRLGRYDECLSVFQQSLALFGPDDKSLYFVAACNELRNQYDSALTYYRQALVMDPGCQLTLAGIKRAKAGLAATLVSAAAIR